MDGKSLSNLEYPKTLDRLAKHTAFSVSAEKAHRLHPTNKLAVAHRWLAETTQARRLLAENPHIDIGGVRDIRSAAKAGARGVVLEPSDLLNIKYTLIAARSLRRQLTSLEERFPLLAETAEQLPIPPGLVDAISHALSDRGEILDTASEKLATIRRDLKVTHDRLLSRMQRMLNDSRIAPYLQEPIITQRDGRYVIPLRADFKGKVKAIVHDQSSSGATLFVEPLSVVQQNNQLRELQLAEQEEQRRILAELSTRIGEHEEALTRMVDVLAEIDLIFARAKFADEIQATEPRMKAMRTSAGSLHPGVTLRLWQARHPLLNPDTVVPIDVELDPNTYALVITGPNTGGKTVTLKTVGLLALMAQSGMHIPAQSGSELSLFEHVFADIGDEQSIEQSLSTFSAHIGNIIGILQRANRRSVVLLDELGAGTDPQEGAALARAILDHLVQRGITTLVATHYPELKTYAHTTPGVVNASVEFDLKSLQPTYRLTIGLPGRSNALAVASRLGLPEEIVAAARQGVHPDDLRADDLLEEIHRQRDLARKARSEAEMALREAESLRAKLASQMENIEDERRQILESARVRAKAEIEALRLEFQQVRRKLAQARQPLEALQAIDEQISELEEQATQPIYRRRVDVVPRQPLRLGSKVRLRSLDREGVVTSLGEENAEVQIGSLRVKTALDDLQVISQPDSISQESPADRPSSSTVTESFTPSSPGRQIDLRGQRVEDALEALDRYLDSAYLAGLPWVRIIHGKGTGRLREAIRKALGQHPHIQSFEAGGVGEGGEGVTIARLRT